MRGYSAGKWGGTIRILSPPVPFAFCFESVGHLMDAVGRAVHTLHVLSSALGRIGSRFFLCVTVRFSERIAARSLFSEYGVFVGAGLLFFFLFSQKPPNKRRKKCKK